MNELLGTYGLRGDISVEQAWNVGKSIADWLPQDGAVAVSGRQGGRLCQAVIEGLRLQGRDVVSMIEGDHETIKSRVVSGQMAGAVRVAYDELEEVNSIEFMDENGALVERSNGLMDMIEAASAGNFVPAARKGELSVLA